MDAELTAAVALVKKALQDRRGEYERWKAEYSVDGGMWAEIFVQACQNYNELAGELGLAPVGE